MKKKEAKSHFRATNKKNEKTTEKKKKSKHINKTFENTRIQNPQLLFLPFPLIFVFHQSGKK